MYRKSGYVRSRILVLSFVLVIAFLLAAEEYIQFFRLKELRVSPATVFAEHTVWDMVDGGMLRFWPRLLLKRHVMERRIRDFLPVNLEIHIHGWGSFEFVEKSLKPRHIILWNQKEWYLSEDGRIWSVRHPANSQIVDMQRPGGPLLEIDEMMPSPISGVNKPNNSSIYASTLNALDIQHCFTSISSAGWYDRLAKVRFTRKEGAEVLILTVNSLRGTFNVVISNDQNQFRRILSAVDEIVQQLPAINSGIIIDTTYDGKIVVKNQ